MVLDPVGVRVTGYVVVPSPIQERPPDVDLDRRHAVAAHIAGDDGIQPWSLRRALDLAAVLAALM
jgi:hypothetical protein